MRTLFLVTRSFSSGLLPSPTFPSDQLPRLIKTLLATFLLPPPAFFGRRLGFLLNLVIDNAALIFPSFRLYPPGLGNIR